MRRTGNCKLGEQLDTGRPLAQPDCTRHLFVGTKAVLCSLTLDSYNGCAVLRLICRTVGANRWCWREKVLKRRNRRILDVVGCLYDFSNTRPLESEIKEKSSSLSCAM